MTKMKFDFKEEHVSEILHMDDAGDWYAAMMEMFPSYEITNENRVAGFIAQTAHESANYKVLTENLNYSSKALDAIFGKYFKRAGVDAKEYHRQQKRLPIVSTQTVWIMVIQHLVMAGDIAAVGFCS